MLPNVHRQKITNMNTSLSLLYESHIINVDLISCLYINNDSYSIPIPHKHFVKKKEETSLWLKMLSRNFKKSFTVTVIFGD